ncbi:hypothetical protein MJG53_006832 [Ovis ammon polii x Ovis aries]|uniref:Uncharacterized protein n=1 Tax=Ovis ammon polii x Ovis aries TaxID=2918886 RepID=A0ACB9V6C0_9CETA|nr:hypothetical protein MJG53_006832 [Ovis ammon polii x Ovis aries]
MPATLGTQTHQEDALGVEEGCLGGGFRTPDVAFLHLSPPAACCPAQDQLTRRNKEEELKTVLQEAVGRTDVWTGKTVAGPIPRAGVPSLALSLESSAGFVVPLKRLDAGDPLSPGQEDGSHWQMSHRFSRKSSHMRKSHASSAPRAVKGTGSGAPPPIVLRDPSATAMETGDGLSRASSLTARRRARQRAAVQMSLTLWPPGRRSLSSAHWLWLCQGEQARSTEARAPHDCRGLQPALHDEKPPAAEAPPNTAMSSSSPQPERTHQQRRPRTAKQKADFCFQLEAKARPPTPYLVKMGQLTLSL